jgi:ArsR family metal-binding transcriptional regulator
MHFLTSAWSQIWPNLVAGLFPSGAVAVSHVKRVNMARRHHAEMKQHVNGVAAAMSLSRPSFSGNLSVGSKGDLDPADGAMLK